MAVVLVVVGAAVSPQGEPLEPRPPDTAWTASAPTPGRAPGVWVLGDRPVVATADGVTAFEPATGETAWTVALSDPACTATETALTCVHGEGENASIATIGPEGDVTEQPFPHADVAVSTGDEVIVAGATSGESPWLGRFTVTSSSAPEPIWRYESDVHALPEGRWNHATVSQGIVTVSAPPEERAESGPVRRVPGLSADLETGEPRPAVVDWAGGRSVSVGVAVNDPWGQTVPPLPGPDLAIPGYPEAVVTDQGVHDSYGGNRILEYRGRPLWAVGDDLIAVGPHPDVPIIPDEGADLEVATRTTRLDVATGETAWQLDRDQVVHCPCSASQDTLVLAGLSPVETHNEGFGPRVIHRAEALLGVDLDSGRHEWTLPISTVPDAIAAGPDRTYVLTGGTLTAYADS